MKILNNNKLQWTGQWNLNFQATWHMELPKMTAVKHSIHIAVSFMIMKTYIHAWPCTNWNYKQQVPLICRLVTIILEIVQKPKNQKILVSLAKNVKFLNFPQLLKRIVMVFLWLGVLTQHVRVIDHLDSVPYNLVAACYIETAYLLFSYYEIENGALHVLPSSPIHIFKLLINIHNVTWLICNLYCY